jgi:hypothetical protein
MRLHQSANVTPLAQSSLSTTPRAFNRSVDGPRASLLFDGLGAGSLSSDCMRKDAENADAALACENVTAFR